MLSPTLSGDGLEAGRTEAVWTTRAAIGRDGSKPVWASRPLQNPPQALGWWCLRFPRAAPFHPQHWPLWSPGSRFLAAGTRGKQPLAVTLTLQRLPPSCHGSAGGVQPETLGVTVERSPPGWASVSSLPRGAGCAGR